MNECDARVSKCKVKISKYRYRTWGANGERWLHQTLNQALCGGLEKRHIRTWWIDCTTTWDCTFLSVWWRGVKWVCWFILKLLLNGASGIKRRSTEKNRPFCLNSTPTWCGRSVYPWKKKKELRTKSWLTNFRSGFW